MASQTVASRMRGRALEPAASYNGSVIKVTIDLPDDLAERVRSAATERGLAAEELARETLSQRFPAKRPVSFIGIGASGSGGNAAQRHNEIRRAHFADKTAPNA